MSHKPQFTQVVHEHIEEWHRHTADEGSPQVEHGSKPNMPLLLIAFVGSVGFVGVTILAAYLYFGAHTKTLRAERIENTGLGDGARAYKESVAKKLEEGNVWLNDDLARGGHVSTPIEKAKEKVLAKYAGKK